jgi:Tfp pilus assembly protein PilF
MDGRWSLYLAAGLAGALSGCSTLTSRQPNGVPTAAAPTPHSAPPVIPTEVAAAPPRKDKNLKPATHVSMGALAEQMAEDMARTPIERDHLRTRARDSYQKAIAADAKYVPAYVALAASFAATDEHDRALAAYAKAGEVAPNDPTVWGSRGMYHARRKEWDTAVEYLGQACKLAPDNKELAKNLGFTLARSGRADEAVSALARCMSEADARFNVARMQQHLGHVDASRQQLQQALRAKPDHEPARELLASLSPAVVDPGVRPAAFQVPAAPAAPPPAAPAKPTVAPPRLSPVIMSGPAPATPVKAGVGGIVEE